MELLASPSRTSEDMWRVCLRSLSAIALGGVSKSRADGEVSVVKSDEALSRAIYASASSYTCPNISELVNENSLWMA